MKKFLLSAATALFALCAHGETVVLEMSELGNANNQYVGSFEVGGFTFEAVGDYMAFDGYYHEIRLKRNCGMKVTSTLGTMTKISFHLGYMGLQRDCPVNADTGAIQEQYKGETEVVWNGEADVVTFSVPAGATATYGTASGREGHLDFDRVTIEYNAAPAGVESTVVFADVFNNATLALVNPWQQDNFTFQCIKGSTNSDPGFYYDPSHALNGVRLYAGSSFSISSSTRTISKIVYTLSTLGQQRLTDYTVDSGELAPIASGDTEVVWTGSAMSVTITVPAGSRTTYGSASGREGNLGVYSVTITYTEPEDAVEAPVFSQESTQVHSSFWMTATSATEGASIYYTKDGSDPDETSTYYDPEGRGIHITKGTTTLKAIAIKNGVKSQITTAEYYVAGLTDANSIKQLMDMGWELQPGYMFYVPDSYMQGMNANFEPVVTYVNETHCFIYDGETYGVIFRDGVCDPFNVEAGDVFEKDWMVYVANHEGHVTLRIHQPDLPLMKKGTADIPAVPVLTDVADINKENCFRIVTLQNVRLTPEMAETPWFRTVVTEGWKDIVVNNSRGWVEPVTADGYYNVTGAVMQYRSGDDLWYELWPISLEASDYAGQTYEEYLEELAAAAEAERKAANDAAYQAETAEIAAAQQALDEALTTIGERPDLAEDVAAIQAALDALTADADAAYAAVAEEGTYADVVDTADVMAMIEALLAKAAESGITALDAETAAAAELYNLLGARVTVPQPGQVYLMHTGTTVRKVVIR